MLSFLSPCVLPLIPGYLSFMTGMTTAELIAERVRACLKHAPADRLSFAPDCGLSQTARWAARQKLTNLVAGVQRVRDEVA